MDVDVVIECEDRLFPFEIRARREIDVRDTIGLAAVRAAHRGRDVAPGIVLAPVETSLRITRTDVVLPWNLA